MRDHYMQYCEPSDVQCKIISLDIMYGDVELEELTSRQCEDMTIQIGSLMADDVEI